ncbi:MAG: helix-turn-helix domain-containing protein [Clostridia bacterium]|nr:helix-turn-helix domain-containing protein [Clostridia bacterium]
MIASVSKAIGILQLLAQEDGRALPLHVICEKTGLNKSTASHLLVTLVRENMVERVSRGEGYRIGYGTFLLTRFGSYQHKIAEVAHPVLRWLTKKTEQTSLICVLREQKRIRIDYVTAAFPLESQKEKIYVEDTYDSATGLVLVAQLPKYEQEIYVAAWSREGADAEAIRERISAVEERGYAECTKVTDGVRHGGIAVPIFKGGKCVAALGLAYFEKGAKTELSRLRAAAKEISRRLDFTVDG